MGGFNGAVIAFPSIFLSFYSASMFAASLLQELPIRDEKLNDRKRTNILKKKLSDGT